MLYVVCAFALRHKKQSPARIERAAEVTRRIIRFSFSDCGGHSGLGGDVPAANGFWARSTSYEIREALLTAGLKAKTADRSAYCFLLVLLRSPCVVDCRLVHATATGSRPMVTCVEFGARKLSCRPHLYNQVFACIALKNSLTWCSEQPE